MPCPCCGGACCYPEMEACTELGDPCGEEGDPACPEGFTCVGGICERLSATPIGTCPGTVSGPVAASCVDGLTQSACETGGGTYHPGQTCEQTCCGPCDEENPCPEGCQCVDGQCVACPPERTCGETCCPEGATCVGYGGDTLTFLIGESCSGEGFNNDPEGQAGIAQQWMNAIAAWMNANGYTGATGYALPPQASSCEACVGPDGTCDLWGSATFGVGGCCDGVQEEDYGPEWLDVFGDVFPGQDPPFYWLSFSGIPDIPPCIPNELP